MLFLISHFTACLLKLPKEELVFRFMLHRHVLWDYLNVRGINAQDELQNHHTSPKLSFFFFLISQEYSFHGVFL